MGEQGWLAPKWTCGPRVALRKNKAVQKVAGRSLPLRVFSVEFIKQRKFRARLSST